MTTSPHEPNPSPPAADPAIRIITPVGTTTVTVDGLRALPVWTLGDSYIISTGHGTTGPFVFEGPRLGEVIRRYADGEWSAAMVISADGFGTRVQAKEWQGSETRPMLLAYAIDGRAMTRDEGLVRLIVPSETDEALRQVKWVTEIRLE